MIVYNHVVLEYKYHVPGTLVPYLVPYLVCGRDTE